MDIIGIKRSLAELSDDPNKALLFILDCYTPTSSKYTFSFAFKSVINDKSVPTVIKGFEELNERISLQRNTLSKLNNANQLLKQKLNQINAQHQMINEKLNKAIEKTRRLFVVKGENEKVYKIKNKFLLMENKKPLMVKEDKQNEVIQVLKAFNKALEKMKEEIVKK